MSRREAARLSSRGNGKGDGGPEKRGGKGQRWRACGLSYSRAHALHPRQLVVRYDLLNATIPSQHLPRILDARLAEHACRLLVSPPNLAVSRAKVGPQDDFAAAN